MSQKYRNILIVIVSILVLLEVLFLKPSSLHNNEGVAGKGLFKDISTLMKSQKKDDEVRYTIDGFHYTAVEGEKKQWEMISDQALLYEISKKVVATNAHIKMYDSAGKITLIEGKEAYYTMGSKDFELKDNVIATFPDGFRIHTSYAIYNGMTQQISSTENFNGESQKTKTEFLQIWGKGFTASKLDPMVHILAESHVKIHRIPQKEVHDVRSDLGKIDRFSKIAFFDMKATDRFVDSDLGSLNVKSRKQEAHYDNAAHVLNFLTATEDVKITEMDKNKPGMKYATCQKADFMAKDDKILLTGFPSVYQETDTVTGELITIFRSKNIIEVNQANGYHNEQQLSSTNKSTPNRKGR